MRIVIGFPKREQAQKNILDEFGNRVARVPARGKIIEKIKGYCNGERVIFNYGTVDWTLLTSFQQKVFKAAIKVSYGKTETYGSIARKAGCPNGSRAVGRALSRNPFPLVIPCHRIVRGDGTLGGFSASGGILLKRKLLKLEGAGQKLKK